MSRFAIVNNNTKKVVNVIIWEGAQLLPPHEHLVVRDDAVDIGDIYNEETNTFTKFYLAPDDVTAITEGE